jgi:hypothetical protein
MALAVLSLPLWAAQDTDSPIDQVLDRLWKQNGIKPAEASTDTEFLRRVYLDIIGVIPPIDELKAFLRDDRPDKRDRMIESLVRSNAFASYWAEKLTNDWLGYGQIYLDASRGGFKKWLRDQLLDGKPYPEIVSRIISADVNSAPGTFVRRWIASNFTKVTPETVATRVSKEFLGIRLHCAQCHDHPFDKWTRQDFFGLAAFFAGIGAQDYGKFEEKNVKSFKFEGFKEPVGLRFLDGTIPPGSWPRRELADWVERQDQLARALCNRVWAYMFGRGVIEPWDDLNAQAKPLVPGLLEVLVAEFKRSDLRGLVKFIAGSRAYQRTSEKLNASDGALFSRAAVRPMLPEQLLNSLMRATGVVPRGSDYNDVKGEFARLFFADRPPEGSDLTAYRGTVQQVLKMLELDNTLYDGARINGRGMLDRLVEQNKSPEAVFEALYLATLTRLPSEREMELCLKHYKKWDEYLNAYEDVFWALLNTNEFFFNH